MLIAVDDELPALQDLIEAVKAALPGEEITGFSSSTKALEFAKRTPVEIAFLDIEMGPMSGLELAKSLKDVQGHTNIVFVTGYSQYAVEAFSLFASGYLLKPVTPGEIKKVLDHLQNSLKKHAGLRIQTFGNFEVFIDEVPLRFPRSKSKELFAYLIHKRGTGCTTRELASVLFEDKPYTLSLQKQLQTVLSSMMAALREAGCEQCVIRRYNWTAIDVAQIKNCDYYRFLNWDVDAVNEYTGEYMANYSWAEFVIGYLDRKIT